MEQFAVELILTRQLASCLAVPVWLASADGKVLYYNESAEKLVGLRFDEAPPLTVAELPELLQATRLDGSPLTPEDLPMGTALRERRPVHRSLKWQGLDGVSRRGEFTAFPLEGQGGKHLGGVVICWEEEGP